MRTNVIANVALIALLLLCWQASSFAAPRGVRSMLDCTASKSALVTRRQGSASRRWSSSGCALGERLCPFLSRSPWNLDPGLRLKTWILIPVIVSYSLWGCVSLCFEPYGLLPLSSFICFLLISCSFGAPFQACASSELQKGEGAPEEEEGGGEEGEEEETEKVRVCGT